MTKTTAEKQHTPYRALISRSILFALHRKEVSGALTYSLLLGPLGHGHCTSHILFGTYINPWKNGITSPFFM